MPPETFSTSDQTQIYTQSWLPDTPRAGVVLVHGYGEHSGRYTHVAEALVSAGYAAFALDHRGHGRSEGLRAYVSSIGQIVDDLYDYTQRVRAQHPSLPLFMLGHSMGSLIALEYTLRHQAQLQGLIISGCAITGAERIDPVTLAIGRVLRRIAPRLPLMGGLPTSALSTDPAVAAAYETDTLVYKGRWRLGTAGSLLDSGEHILAQATALRLPLLILHGADDEITPVSGSQRLNELATSPDKTLIIYPGMRHEVLNERDKQRVIADVLAWLNNH